MLRAFADTGRDGRAAFGRGAGMANVEGTPRGSKATPVGPPAPVPPTEGWKLDPFGRYEARRWDGTAWTAEVLHNGYLRDDPAPLVDPGRWAAQELERREETSRFEAS